MGGTGSGRWHNHRARPIAEQTPSLLLSGELRRLYRLAQRSSLPVSRSVQWWWAGRNLAACQISFLANAKVIFMRLVWRTNAKVQTTDVALTVVPKQFGGVCAFWLCPSCQRRCGALYLLKTWRCRRCARITYVSSNRSDRRVSQALNSPQLANAVSGLRSGDSVGELNLAWKARDLLRRRSMRLAQNKRSG